MTSMIGRTYLERDHPEEEARRTSHTTAEVSRPTAAEHDASSPATAPAGPGEQPSMGVGV